MSRDHNNLLLTKIESAFATNRFAKKLSVFPPQICAHGLRPFIHRFLDRLPSVFHRLFPFSRFLCNSSHESLTTDRGFRRSFSFILHFTRLTPH